MSSDTERYKIEELESEIRSYKQCKEGMQTELNNWKDTAMQNQRNSDYYRMLLVACGKSIGKEAYIADDGNIATDVLCAKVPYLVSSLCGEVSTIRESSIKLSEVMQIWDKLKILKVNSIGYCDLEKVIGSLIIVVNDISMEQPEETLPEGHVANMVHGKDKSFNTDQT